LTPVNEQRQASRPLNLRGKIQRRGKVLLSQQCWLWGQDVKRPEGNLLVAHGFERLRALAGISGSTQYTLSLPKELRVRLWGFGMYFGAAEGIYINRYEFTPRTARFQEPWQSAESMSRLPRSGSFELLAQAAHWIAEYENWVLDAAGLPYRRAALSGWKETCSAPGSIASAWRRLASEIQAVERARCLYETGSSTEVQRHSAHLSSTKNSCPVARNLEEAWA